MTSTSTQKRGFTSRSNKEGTGLLFRSVVESHSHTRGRLHDRLLVRSELVCLIKADTFKYKGTV